MEHSTHVETRSTGAFLAAGLIISIFASDARATISMPQTAAAPVPLDPLKSPVASVRRKAVTDLGKSRAPGALPRLVELIRDPDTDVRMAVLRSIASLRDLAGMPSMLVFMTDASHRIRAEAIDGVVEIYTGRDRPGGMSRFLSVFSDGRDKPEPLVVAPPDFEVHRSLASLLKDSDPGVRESASEAIGILGGTEVTVDLVNALRDREPRVRQAAIGALAKVGTSADGEALIPLVRDTNGGVRRRAIGALGRLKAQDGAIELRRAYNAAADPEERLLALAALAQLALPEDRAFFAQLSGQTDPRRRRIAVEGLGRLKDVESMTRLKRGFQREKDDELRAAYAFAIFCLDDRPFLDTVVLGLGGSRDRARQSRAYLEELGSRTLPDALEYLKEGDPKVRSGLADAFANAGVVNAMSALEPLQRDADAMVRASTLRALAILRRQK